MPAQRPPVVLDPHRRGLRRTQRHDAEQVSQGAVVNADRRRDLKEADQLEPVQSLSTGLVLVHLGQAGVDGRVVRDQPVDVGKAEEPADAVHHRVNRGRHQPGAAEVSDVQLHVGSLDPIKRVQAVGLAPLEPPPELVGVQAVGVSGVPGQI